MQVRTGITRKRHILEAEAAHNYGEKKRERERKKKRKKEKDATLAKLNNLPK